MPKKCQQSKFVKWTNRSLSKYCRFVLGSPVRAIFVPYKKLGYEAMVHPHLRNVLFYSDRHLSRATIWHECGHLSVCNKISLGNITAANVSSHIRMSSRSIGLACSEKRRVDPKRLSGSLDFFALEERIEHESRAHIWAITESVRRGYVGVTSELIQTMDRYWDSCPVYSVAKQRVLSRILVEKICGSTISKNVRSM